MKLQEDSAALLYSHLTQHLHQLGTGLLVVALTFIKNKKTPRTMKIYCSQQIEHSKTTLKIKDQHSLREEGMVMVFYCCFLLNYPA